MPNETGHDEIEADLLHHDLSGPLDLGRQRAGEFLPTVIGDTLVAVTEDLDERLAQSPLRLGCQVEDTGNRQSPIGRWQSLLSETLSNTPGPPTPGLRQCVQQFGLGSSTR